MPIIGFLGEGIFVIAEVVRAPDNGSAMAALTLIASLRVIRLLNMIFSPAKKTMRYITYADTVFTNSAPRRIACWLAGIV
jgi:hypothetical protein